MAGHFSLQGQTSDSLAIYIFAYLTTLFHQKTASRKKKNTQTGRENTSEYSEQSRQRLQANAAVSGHQVKQS